MDLLGAPRNRGQQHFRRRDRKIGAVMLADANEMDAEFVRQHGFVDHVAQHLTIREPLPIEAVVMSPNVSRPSSIGAAMRVFLFWDQARSRRLDAEIGRGSAGATHAAAR